MAPRMGERTPIPVRDMERERQAEAASPVVTYKLPPEEIERIFSGKKAEGKAPIDLRPNGGREKNPNLSKGADDMRQRKDGPDCGLTKKIFLEQIATGETMSSIEKAWGMKYNTIHAWVKTWELKGITPGKARELLAGMEESVIEEDRTTTVDLAGIAIKERDTEIEEWRKSDLQRAEENMRLRQANDYIKAENERLTSDNAELLQEVADLTNEVADLVRKLEGRVEPVTGDIEWFSLEAIRPDPTISINSQGISFDGEATKRMGLKPADSVMVGFAAGKLVFRKSDSGIRLQKGTENTVRFASRRLATWSRFKALAKKKYSLHQDATGLFFAEVEVSGG